MCARSLGRSTLLPGIEHDLDALVLLVAKSFVGLGSLVEAEAVRDDHGWIDLAALNTFEQRLHVIQHLRLPHAEGQAFAEGRAPRPFVDHAAVNAGDRDGSAFAAGLNDFAQHHGAFAGETERLFGFIGHCQRAAVSFHSHRLDASIRSTTARHFFQCLDHVINFVAIDNARAGLAREAKALRPAVYRDHLTCTEQNRAADSELAHRAATPDGDHITLMNIAVFGSHIARRKNISEEEDFLIRQTIGNLHRTNIGKRNAYELSLAASVATQEMRVAEPA